MLYILLLKMVRLMIRVGLLLIYMAGGGADAKA
jgi:hypothetical protein